MQVADEKAEAEAKTAKAFADAEARVKMTIKGVRKELGESLAAAAECKQAAAEYKQRCEALQAAVLHAQQQTQAVLQQGQQQEQAAAASAAAAAARHQAEMRHLQDEMEAQACSPKP